ncbi:hypothetical protein ABZ835_20115 [Streptomyces sp. NPDC047461]|uniref:hypothetical protein n=1 Tax=Streptomyces sp. NPDC047461 TaxID=3155619 RepID=UPI0034049723
MSLSLNPLLLVRPGRLSADGAVGAGVFSAVSFALLTTALAALGYHLAFAEAASGTACLAAMVGLFAGRLLCVRRPRSLLFDVGAMALAQVSTCCWFACHSPDLNLVRAAFHGEVGGAVHLMATMVAVGALRAAGVPRFCMSTVVQKGLSAFAYLLRVLISAQTAAAPAAYVSGCTGARRSGDEEAVSEVLSAGAVGRRGPP